MKNKLPPFIIYLLLVFIQLMLLFYIARKLLFNIVISCSDNAFKANFENAYQLGFKFDLMVSTYLVIIPFLIFSISFLFNKTAKKAHRIIFFLTNFAFVFSLLACCVDIPFYQNFNSRLTNAVLMWISEPSVMMEFVRTEPKFYPFIFSFLIISALFIFVNRFISKKLFRNYKEINYSLWFRILIFIPSLILVAWGIRGSNIKRPVQIRDAFVSNNAFQNQVALNPVHTYFDSFDIFKVKYFEDETAIKNVQSFLQLDQTSNSISRKVNGNDSIKKNVVYVLMESMSAEMMGAYGNKKNLTPFLDSLCKQTLWFDNFYSCGIHTCNGIFGGIYGFPALMNGHPMSNLASSQLYYKGLPGVLKDNNYYNTFFCTHQPTFDNMEFFLKRNYYDKLYSSDNYPPNKIVNCWGISDEYLYEFALRDIDSVYANKKRFFSTILTISTHPPQMMPTNTVYKPKSKEVLDQVFEYTDWAVKNFMKECSTKPWYNNTVFVFVGDHGINLPSDYDAPLSLNRVPLIFFEPGNPKRKETSHNFGMQIDIMPTLLSILEIPYTNNTIGQDLTKEKRPYAFFTQDNKLGIINENNFLVLDKSGFESFYHLTKSEITEEEKQKEIDAMKNYTYSFLQTAQWLIDNKKTE